MKIRYALAVGLVGLFCLGCNAVVAFGDDCTRTAPRAADLAAAGATRVSIDAGAGSLEVIGAPGATDLRARGTACADRESVLEEIQLVAERRGDALHLEARFPRNHRGSASLDIEVTIPAELAVRIDDGSGDLAVRGVASLSIEDGSGSITVADVAGSVEVDDGSGDVELLGIGGDVTIDDGSGGIDVRGAGGRVRIDDGSGSISVRDVDGDVIAEDGSGSILIVGVGGSVVIEEDGSGDIRVEDVRGDFWVKDDGSGSVDFDRIDGRVSIDDD